MKCPQCHFDNRADAQFCIECSQRLEVACPQCGNKLPPAAKFCDGCGHTLDDTPPRTTSSSSAERKHVTVLFSDLSGYTAISEKLDPEEVREITSRIFGEVAKILDRYEGFVEKYIGDAVMALFGVPQAHEDDHLRAIRAAKEIHEAISVISLEYEERIGRNLTFHTGIATGLVVTGEIDLEKGTHGVAGDTINLASRLSGIAKPGEILTAETTYLHTKGSFSFEKLGPVSLKGKAERVTSYRLVEEKAKATRGLATQGISSPLVGRNAEMVAIKGCVNRLLDGQGGILSVIGEAGLGKSRLMAEIRRHFQNENLLWLEGRTLSYGQKISYWPFKEILRQYAGITEDDGDAEAWEKFETKITGLFEQTADEILPYLASLLGIEVRGELGKNLKYLDGESMGRQVYLSSRRFFERLASTRSLVLVFEDLHWADESSTLLIEHLFPLINRVPILMCGVSRPETKVPAARLQETALRDYERRYTEIRLNPLSPTECTQLMDNLLEIENLPGRARHVILQKAEGNPFFLEEIMRTLIDRKAVLREGNHWRATSSLETLTIPDTIQGVIMARIDRLDEELKAVLRTASVIGRAFLYRLLKAVAEAVRELDERVERLKNMELIREKQKVPELEYIFKHALVQESTYESILLKKRQELHARVASVVETLFSERIEEFSSVLAYHYAKAEDWNKAQDYLLKAGDQAGRIAADAEALSHYEQALETYARVFGDRWNPVERASLERKMGEALFRRGEHEKAMEYFRHAVAQLGRPFPEGARAVRLAIVKEIAVQIGHRLMPGLFVKKGQGPAGPLAQEEAHLYETISWITAMGGDPEMFLLNGLRLLNLSERNALHLGTVEGFAVLQLAADFLGLFRIADYCGRTGLGVAKTAKEHAALGYAYLGITAHRYYLGRLTMTLDSGRCSVEAFRTSGYWNLHGWALAERLVDQAHYYLGNFAEASTGAQELIRFGEDANDRQAQCWGLVVLGMSQYGTGHLQEAVSTLREAAELAKAVPDPNSYGSAGSYLGRCYVRLGNLPMAFTTLRDTEAFLGNHRAPSTFNVPVHNALAEAFLFAGEQSTGSENSQSMRDVHIASRKALKAAKAHARYGVPEAMRLRGTYEWLTTEPTGAQKWWMKSLRFANETGMRHQSGMTHLEIGRRLKDLEHLRQADAIFSEIGAEWDLAETRRLLERFQTRASTAWGRPVEGNGNYK
jgi:class 3 adenylate cyclase/tetratricopeptide (TPR) repeat protein